MKRVEQSCGGFTAHDDATPGASLLGWYHTRAAAERRIAQLPSLTAFAAAWWRIGTLMNWQARMQPALAVLGEEYRVLLGISNSDGGGL